MKVLYFSERMTGPQICKSGDHLFTPILEVTIPLLRCVHCNVYAYHDTVKQLAKNRSYPADREEVRMAPPLPYWRRLWLGLRRSIGAV
jgi:hypothetical protein